MNSEKKEAILVSSIIGLFALVLILAGFLIYDYGEINNLKKVLLEQKESADLQNSIIATEISKLKKESEESSKTIKENFESLLKEIGVVKTESLEKIKTVEQKGNGDFSELIQKVLPAIVSIRTNSGVGSGVIIDKKGRLVTNYHVIKNALLANVLTYEKKEYPLSVVASDANSDLAILEIRGASKEFEFLEFSEEMTAGERVIALGNPGGLDFSVSQGIISATERTGPNGVIYIQTDVPINPGNSGGPIINKDGKILGITTMKVSGFEGVGFAVHSRIVKDMIRNNLREK